MSYNKSNSAFLSWEGTINRKDYVINMLILLTLALGMNFININVLAPEKITNTILSFLIQFLQFIFVISVLSVVYRRITDFSSGRTYKFKKTFYYLFIALFVFPVLYFYVFAYFLNFIPYLTTILGIYSLVAITFAFILSIIFCFLKAK